MYFRQITVQSLYMHYRQICLLVEATGDKNAIPIDSVQDVYNSHRSSHVITGANYFRAILYKEIRTNERQRSTHTYEKNLEAVIMEACDALSSWK